MKKLIPAYVISFIFSFMLFIYEPITMYANNMDDFWFNLHIIFKPIFLMFLILFVGLSLLFTGIYFANKKFFNKLKIYEICLLILFICFICTYIQGNFLANNLPHLDGSEMEWGKYKLENIISIVLWVVAIGSVVLCSIKFKISNVVKYVNYISIAVGVMLCTSFVTTLITPKLFDKDLSVFVSTNNFNNASKDKNFFILVLDAVDSEILEQEMYKDDDFDNLFDDFTYFKDTMSIYPFTRDSIPSILTGKMNKNEEAFDDYYTKAMDKSLLIDELLDRDYSINLYEEDIKWNSEKAFKTDNLLSLSRTIDKKTYIKEQTKYILFKYLPYPLKKYSRIESLDFGKAKVSTDTEHFHWANVVNYPRIRDNEITKIDNKYFQFLHIEGAHPPYNFDKDMNVIENGTYEEKVQGNLTMIKTYLNRLKEAGVYDNSVIMIMADHGFVLGNELWGRQNPILFIKGINEHHDMITSDIPVSFTDLDSAYVDLLNDKKSTELFSDIDKDRERIFLLYSYGDENHMKEYKQTGKAWNEDTLKETGKEYNR